MMLEQTDIRDLIDTSDAFIVDLEGFEGPLDLLLSMARTQKVDLSQISIVALVDQYAGFIEEARTRRLELAADYLVMAAWLTYLKSRLLVPDPPDDDEPDPQAMAEALALRLQKLAAVRDASDALWKQPMKNLHLFASPNTKPIGALAEPEWSATLYDLIDAYALLQEKKINRSLTLSGREVWSLSDARELIVRALGELAEWTPFEVVLEAEKARSPRKADMDGMKASAFAASLELVREGMAELQQDEAFAPLLVRAAPVDPQGLSATSTKVVPS